MKKKSAKEIMRYFDTDLWVVPEELRYLLKIDPEEIMYSISHRQSYWLLAMKAARCAGRRTAGRGLRQGTGKRAKERRRAWNNKMRDQLTLDTRVSEQAAEEWGREAIPKTTKRRSRAGESAALKSNK